MKKVLTIIVFYLAASFLFILFTPDAIAWHGHPSEMVSKFVHENGSTDWEVAYRYYWGGGGEPTSVFFATHTNIDRNTTFPALSGTRVWDWGTNLIWGPQWGSSSHHPNRTGDEYEMQWGTTCRDPLSGPVFQTGNSGGSVVYYLFGANVSSGRSGANNSGAYISYAYGNDIVGTTSSCPFPCPNPSCSGRCGTIRNNCGYGISNSANCGGCGGNFCGSGGNRCDRMNPTCNSNNYCVNVVSANNTTACRGNNNCCFNDSDCGGNEYCHSLSGADECRNYLRISGNVFVDRNRNGSWDGEPQDLGLGSKTVERRPASNSNWSDSANTSGSGGYSFNQLNNPSSHDVRIIMSEYDTACRYNFQGTNPRNNVDATNNNINFRFTETLYDISGTVFDDANGNNVLDASDPPFINRPNVQINVMNEGRNDNLNPGNGRFSIGGNPEGNYTIRLVTTTLPGNFRMVGSTQRDVTINCGNSSGNSFLVTNASPPPPAPDLDITSFSFPSGPVSTPANASVRIQNSGNAGTGAGFNVRVRNSPGGPPVIAPGGGALGVGVSRTLTIPVTRPATAGTYTADAYVDPPPGVITESDEGNNTSTVSYNATSGSPVTPNLIITSFSVPDGPVSGAANALVTIQNNGGSGTGVGFRVSVDNGDGIGTPASLATGVLAVGASRTLTIPITRPAIGGTYNAEAIVDSSGAIVEADETDNDANDNYNATAGPPPPPTYTITGGMYYDLNSNNSLGAGESYQDADLQLTGSVPPPPTLGSSWPVDITSFPGSGFTIDDLNAGQYTISFPVGRIPPGYIATYPTSAVIPPPRYTLNIGPGCAPVGPPGNQTICTAGSQSRVNFGIVLAPVDPWYQGIGGDMRSDNDFLNEIPSGLVFSELGGNLPAPGLVFGFNLGGSTSEQRIKANARQWLIRGARFAPSTIKTSYSYVLSSIQKAGETDTIRNMFGGSNPACSGSAPNCTFSSGITSGIFRASGNITIGGSTFSFPDNGDFIFLINGNLNINSAILIPETSTAIFIVSGNINVGPTVRTLHGIYSADDSFTVQGASSGSDQPLEIQGSVVANAGKNTPPSQFTSERDLETRNADTPSVQIIYRPDFILNSPALIRSSTYTIQELAPGDN